MCGYSKDVRILLKRTIVTAVVLPLFLSICATSLLAATYYVDASAVNDAGNGSETSPKKTISAGIILLHSGDTLIIEDGVYTGTLNMIGTVAPKAFPPAGIDRDHLTTIKARNIGGAIIDGNYTDVPFSNANQAVPSDYLHIDGIHFRRGNAGVFTIKGHYSKVTNCGFEDGQSPTDTRQLPIADIAGNNSGYILFEDCWAWGKGRYGVYFGGSSPGVDHSVFRRVVVRQDDAATGPVGGIMFYNGHDNVCQNCVVIDSTDTSASEHYGAFSATANYPSSGPSTLNDKVVGSIALNNARLNGYQPQYNIGTFTIEDTVLWGNGKSGLVTGANTIGTISANHLTIGANTVDGVSSNPYYKTSFIDVENSISSNNGRYGFYYGRTASYVDTYGNIKGSTGTSLTNALTANPMVNALKYLPRIEKASTLTGAGSDGTDVGANVMYQIGNSGSFYGDGGWDEVSTNALWPYPNEAIWAAKMKAYTASGPGGNRGFAAVNTATPLTDYIWGYLGSTVPPFNVKATAAGAGVAVSWNAASANANIAGYKVYVGTSSGIYNVSGYETGKEVGNVTSSVLSGLQSGQTYYIAVTAIDSLKGESGFSYECKSDVTDTDAPVVSFSAPAINSTVTAISTVNVTATDNMAVTKVEFYINGILQGSESAAPYVFIWDTTKYSNGIHLLSAKAYDAAGNVGQASNLPVIINRDVTPPTIGFLAPAAGTTIGGTVAVKTTMSDDFGVTRAELYIDGELTASFNTTPYIFNWNTVDLANGQHTLSAKAYDAAGNVGQSAIVAVNVFNDTTAPTVSIASPTANGTGSGSVAVSANASDNVAVTKVEFYVNGALQTISTSAPYSFNWNTYALANGTYALTAKAYDAAGNIGQSSDVTVNVFNDTTAPTVAFLAPSSNYVSGNNVSIGSSATDDVAVSKMELYIDGSLKYTTTSSSFNIGWNFTLGKHTIVVKAYDAANNVNSVSKTINRFY